MQMPKNKFKQGLAKGERQIGIWSSLCSNVSAEILGQAGFDWIVLDMEHAPNEIPMVISQMQALSAGGSSIVVRPPWSDMVTIKRVLDSGAQTILLPYIENVEEAEAAVSYCRYPKKGVRGVAGGTRAMQWGRVKDYMQEVEQETCILLQVETIEAMENIEAIGQVDGVDGVFIGPSDLSASMGHLGNANHPDVQAAIKSACERLAAVNVSSGILGTTDEAAKRYIDLGYNFVAVGNDAGVFANAVDAVYVRHSS